MNTVTITITPTILEVRSPYEARDVIKESIPSTMRSWSKTRKVWLIDLSQKRHLTAVLQISGFQVLIIGDTPPPPRYTPPPPQRSWVDQCFDACPPPLRTRLRRVLMSVFHPDLGGDPTIAKQINSTADYHERRSA